MANLLTNREFHVNGTWYSPEKRLQEYNSVVMTELTDTTSSAGDWTGYLIQKIFKKFHLIIFSQENDYPNGRGFTLKTGEDVVATFDKLPTKEQVYNLLYPQSN